MDTAEKALTEALPHVVDKLVEGRGKRLRLLEESAKERRKELEQRSAETCAVSSAHLESFLLKAERNLEIASGSYSEALELLKESLLR